MNIWTEKSIELANQRDYLDQLFKVYPMANNLKRELSESNLSQINLAFNEKDNEKLIRLLLEQELFPVKDSYVAYLRRDKSAINRNPRTIDSLSGMVYEMGIEVIKIAILDGVLYIPNEGKMYQQLLDAKEDEVIISALLLRDFLYSL